MRTTTLKILRKMLIEYSTQLFRFTDFRISERGPPETRGQFTIARS